MPVQKHKPSAPSQSPMHLHGHSPHGLVNPMNDSRRSHSESHYDDNYQSGYGPDGYPLSMKLALENPVFTTNTFMRNSKSTPALDYDSDTSEDSTYAIPFQNEFPKRHSCLPVQSAPPPKPTKPKPPLPRRNTKTKLTSNRQALSHENLLRENRNGGIPSHYASQGSLLRPSTVYEDLKDSQYIPLEISDNRSRIKYVVSSTEALDRLPEQTDDIKARRELLAQSQRPYKSPSVSSNSTFYQPTDSPFYLKKSKVAFGVASYDDPLIAQPQKPLGSFPGSKGVEPSSRKSSVSSNNEVLINGSTVLPSPYKSPSESSNSTFYQPVDSPFYLKKPKVAFGVGAYDEPLAVPPPKAPHLPFSSNKRVNSPNTTASPLKSHHTPLSPKSQQLLPLPSNKMANSPNVIRPLPQKKTPILKPRKPTVPPPPTPSKDKRKSMPIKTVTTMYFVEHPQHPILSQSMDMLDEGHHPASPVRESSPSYSPPSTISTARSLGSLLSSDASQRSYNQPTLI